MKFASSSCLALDTQHSTLSFFGLWSVVDARDPAKVADQVRLLAGTLGIFDF